MDNPSSAEAETCRQMFNRPSAYRKDGQERVVNKFRTVCVVCGDTLLPGEGEVGSKDSDTGRLRWICGAGRFQRQ